MTTALVILARAPEPGRVKTRLAAAIGQDAALHVYRRLLARTAAIARRWRGPVQVRFAGGAAAFAACPLAEFAHAAQVDGSLGARLRDALDQALVTHGRAIAIGTDCPELDLAHLDALDRLLDRHEVAIGPAADGGYWGIGMRDRRWAAVCADEALPWSTPGLLAATRRRLDEAACAHGLGPRLHDLDEVDDLRRARRLGLLERSGAIRLSIVVPVRNEAAALPCSLARLAAIDDAVEVIVADGGSVDDGFALAREHPVVDAALAVSGGRHLQLNAALEVARGRHLLCLPIDARLPARAVPRLLALLDATQPAAGCLSRHASDRSAVHRWLDRWARARARATRGAYMDQGPLFARAAALAAGGFRAVGPYDTADLGRRIAGQGARFAVLPVPMVISCRAYARRGFVAVTWAHQRIRLRHHLRPGR